MLWVLIELPCWGDSNSNENICCGYSLESSRRGDSNVFPQRMFLCGELEILWGASWLNQQNDLCTQRSLGIRPIWLESSLSAWWNSGSLATHRAPSEDSNQTGQMLRLIWVFTGGTCHFVGFVMMRLLLFNYHQIPSHLLYWLMIIWAATWQN